MYTYILTFDGLRLKDEENPLWKHCLVEHEGRTAEFSMKQTNVFGSCLVRQVNEAVHYGLSNVIIRTVKFSKVKH